MDQNDKQYMFVMVAVAVILLTFPKTNQQTPNDMATYIRCHQDSDCPNGYCLFSQTADMIATNCITGSWKPEYAGMHFTDEQFQRWIDEYNNASKAI